MRDQAISSWLVSWKLRPLPVALAHRFHSIPFGDPKLETLKNLYWRLSEPEQAMFRTELVRAISAAKALNA